MTLEQLDAKLDSLAAMIREVCDIAANDDPQWLRMPKRDARCPRSGFSRTTIQRLIDSGAIRSRKVGGARFYSGADTARHIANNPAPSSP